MDCKRVIKDDRRVVRDLRSEQDPILKQDGGGMKAGERTTSPRAGRDGSVRNRRIKRFTNGCSEDTERCECEIRTRRECRGSEG